MENSNQQAPSSQQPSSLQTEITNQSFISKNRSNQSKKFGVFIILILTVLVLSIGGVGLTRYFLVVQEKAITNVETKLSNNETSKQVSANYEKIKLFSIPSDQKVITGERYAFNLPEISPHGEHYAYVKTVKQGDKNKYTVIYDGKEGNAYDLVSELKFSKDGNRFAYVGDDNTTRHSFVVLNGKVLDKKYFQIRGFSFSEDSKQFAYVANVFLQEKGGSIGETNDYFTTVINGTEGPQYDYVSNFQFSPDGKHYSYHAIKTMPSPVIDVLDGKEKHYQGGNVLVSAFSKDGSKFAVVVERYRPDSTTIYVNDQEVKRFDSIVKGALLFDSQGNITYSTKTDEMYSPDGKQVAYADGVGDQYYLFVNGQKTDKKIGFYNTPRFVFTPDSKRIAYIQNVDVDDKFQFVLDNVVSKPYYRVTSIVFTPDSQHYAYVAATEKPNDLYKNKYVVVIDGKESELYDYFYNLYAEDNGFRYYVGLDHDVYQVRQKVTD